MSSATDAVVKEPSTRLAVIWIDWYAYHVARFRGLLSSPELAERVAGIELVGGIGVHAGLKFREPLPADLPVQTLLPEASWQSANQLQLACLLWRHLNRVDPGAVLVPGYYTFPAVAAALWARSNNRVSILMTESTSHDHQRRPVQEFLKGALLRTLFGAAVTGGKAHVRYLHQLGFPPQPIAHFYDVVDNETIAAGIAELRRAPYRPAELPPSPYFLYVGRIAPEKNIGRLLSAWLSYREGGGQWPLVLVGDGPDTDALRQQVASSPHAPHVLFAGLRGSRDLLPFYAFAGCFVLPSTREPWGLVINEAMAASLPVLVSDRCGSAEDLVEGGQNGYTFSPEDEGALRQLLFRIADLSPEQRQHMGEKSGRRIAAYSPQNFGQQIARLLSR